MCQAMVQKKRDKFNEWSELQRKLANAKDEKVTLEVSKKSFDDFVTALEEYMGIIGDYSSSLMYIGQCLKYVVINDRPFDQDKCLEMSDSMSSLKEELNTIKLDFKTQSNDMRLKIEQLGEDIIDLEPKVTAAKTAYDNVDENSDCGVCAECLAAADAAAKAAYRERVESAPDITQIGRAGSCFLAGTKVYTKDGLVNIEDIKAGDLVLSYNIDRKTNVYNKVKELLIHENSNEDIYELSINNKILKVTENHRFYIIDEKGYSWIAVKNLKVDDQVMFCNSEIHSINEIKKYSHNGIVYNLEVENDHNYYVSEDGILVHNRKQWIMERL